MPTLNPRSCFCIPESEIYLDNAATMPKSRAALNAMDDFQRHANANVHRGNYALSRHATERYEASRTTVAQFIGAENAREIVFTHGATEAINLLAYCLKQRVAAGSSIVVSALEHHANLLPWQRLARESGARLHIIPCEENGSISLETALSCIDTNCSVVSISATSNVTGTRPDVRRIAEHAHRVGAFVVVDAAQAIAHDVIDIQALRCDALVFSAHKIGGPFGIGALWCRQDDLERFPPFLLGGGIVQEVLDNQVRYLEAPWRFEAGTPSVAEAIGFAAAIRQWENIDRRTAFAHEAKLAQQLHDGIAQLNTIQNVSCDPRSPVISLTSSSLSAYDIATLLAQFGICVRAGKHCAEPYLRALGFPSLCRLSLSVCTSEEDVIRTLEVLRHIDAMGGEAA